MKLTPAKIKECAAWVEKNGLYPQPKGSPVRTYCKALGISEDSHARWLVRSADYADALNRARELFRSTVVEEVVNATVQAAKGFQFEKVREDAKAVDEVVEEFDPVTGNLIRRTTSKKLVTVKAVRERYTCPPDVKAATLVLTNMDSENWKVRQETKQTIIPERVVVESQEQADKLDNIADIG